VQSRRIVGALLVFAGLLIAHVANAFEFVPTQPEFYSWPSYCQARYVTTDIGMQQPWVAGFPREKITAAITQIGADTFERVHHYCAGLTWLSRARTEQNPKVKQFYLRNAGGEAFFTYSRLQADSPIRTTVLLTLGQINLEAGDSNRAVELFQEAIRLQPQEASAYSAMAMAQRRLGRLDLAKQYLQQGNTAVEGESAEIHYNLGLILLELGDTDGAVEQATLAYSDGYPLPGLMHKLSRLGRWPVTAKAN